MFYIWEPGIVLNYWLASTRRLQKTASRRSTESTWIPSEALLPFSLQPKLYWLLLLLLLRYDRRLKKYAICYRIWNRFDHWFVMILSSGGFSVVSCFGVLESVLDLLLVTVVEKFSFVIYPKKSFLLFFFMLFGTWVSSSLQKTQVPYSIHLVYSSVPKMTKSHYRLFFLNCSKLYFIFCMLFPRLFNTRLKN